MLDFDTMKESTKLFLNEPVCSLKTFVVLEHLKLEKY